MKAKEVLRLLQITRPTLSKYIKEGSITSTMLPNHRHNYDEESVYKYLNKNVERDTVIYSRVSTYKQKNSLKNQTEMLKQYCFSNGTKLNAIYSDIASGINFDKRKEFFNMLDNIIAGKIKKVIIAYRDRLSRIGFSFFKRLFSKYNCEIEVISEIGSEKLDSEEIFEEIVSLLHCYSMKLYSKRKDPIIKKIINDK